MKIVLSTLLLVLLALMQCRAALAQPIAINDKANGVMGRNISVNVLANDTGNGLTIKELEDPIIYEGTSGLIPDFLTASFKDGVITYFLPLTDDTKGYNITIKYTVTDPAGATSQAELKITVAPLNCPTLPETTQKNLPCLSPTATRVAKCARVSYCTHPRGFVTSKVSCQYDYAPPQTSCVGANGRSGFCLGTSGYCRMPFGVKGL